MTNTKKDIRIFNQHLRFSWSHIIAFIGLIAAAYITFMGFTYMTGGDFMLAGIGTAVTVLLLAFVFIGVQQLKATDHKFDRSIRRERVMLCLTPVVMAIAMWPMMHFWAVRANDRQIVDTFTEAISSSRQMFDNYEAYSAKRISAYRTDLGEILADRTTNPTRYRDAGFREDLDSICRRNMERTLYLQLLSHNYDKTRTEALAWIDAASQGASTWNVFLLGNTRQIKDAVNDWHKTLDQMSNHLMTNENQLTGSFGRSDGTATEVTSRIDRVSDAFTNAHGGVIPAIIFGILLYGFLLFPYLIQGRNTRSMVTLTGRRSSLGGTAATSSIYDDYDDADDTYGSAETEAEPEPRHKPRRKAAAIRQTDEDDDYQIF